MITPKCGKNKKSVIQMQADVSMFLTNFVMSCVIISLNRCMATWNLLYELKCILLLDIYTVCKIFSNYYTSDSLWKIWLVKSIQSIHNSLWTWHDKCNICCRYCIYHVKFNVCLVTKPLGWVFSSETEWLNTCCCFWGWIMSNNWGERFQKHKINYYDKLLLYFKIFNDLG